MNKILCVALMCILGTTVNAKTLGEGTKIAATLNSTILIDDKAKSQNVEVKVLEDVVDQNNKVVIPKGSLLKGTIDSFDKETGSSEIKINSQNLTVGSADGSTSLKGQVFDSRGKYVVGALVTTYSAGASAWFPHSVLSEQSKDSAGLNAAALEGSSGVMKKIAEMNVPKNNLVLYAPKGLPLVLYTK